jgi:Holliday junction DNA helicase RuvB
VIGTGKIDLDITQRSLHALDVDERGLDDMDRRLLLTIMEKFSGGPVGVETLAASLREDKETIEDVYEPYLMQEGFLERTPRGRLVTRHAYGHLGKNVPRGLFQ